MGSKTELYPVGPASVPADLTRPTAAYRRHAYLALAGLFAFLLLYFSLAGWFAWTAFRLLSSVSRAPNPVFPVLGGVCAAFLAAFMLKAVLFVRRGQHTGDIEITPDEHPALFAFLHRLADEARAPRPRRVYLSAQVNAAVFFDLSIVNLVIPSRKNLEIGLGLVNVLTLGELKAVLAHELGHFAQRTMAVGRWVYIAQQIAGHIVVRRDALDRFLQWLSAVDLRVAWLGWLLRLVVWSIRSLVDTVFSWVLLAQRALSREMELQADLVAVSLTGSDALIHALHRLDAADDAMDRALGFAAAERQGGRAVADLFALQARMLVRKREILADPAHGAVPALPATPEGHRLFKARLAHPPRMWATHPPNEVREDNAKRVYVAAPLDDRAGWGLFREPQRLRERVTASLYQGEGPAPAVVPIAETLASFDARFDRRFFDPAYRGAYLGRSVVRDAATPADLYGAEPAPDDVVEALEALYPPSLSTDLEQARELAEEKAMVEALQRGILEMPGGVVRCRGREVRRRELPALVAELDEQLTAVRGRVRDHDRRVRAVHLAAARTLPNSLEWETYLRGLAALLHYADHREADLEDAVGSLQNVFAVVTADRRVTASEIDRLVAEAGTVYGVLEDIHDQASKVELSPEQVDKLGGESWAALLGPLELPPPNASNIGEWMDAAHTWAAAAGGELSALSSTALDELLRAEEVVALHARSGRAAPDAPPPPRLPPRYAVLLPGEERPRQTKLGWWDRFQVADGLVPAVARLAVAGALVGAVLWAGRSTTGEAWVVIVNGLARPVLVEIGDREVEVDPHAHASVELEGDREVEVSARTVEGDEIERFSATLPGEYGRAIYDVAGAAPLVVWRPRTDAETPLGAPRWRETEATEVFDDASQVSARDDAGAVLISLARLHPQRALGALRPEDARAVVAAHARWDPPGAPYLGVWLEGARGVDPEGFAVLLAARLKEERTDVTSLRFQQDLGPRDDVCARHAERAALAPQDPDWQYLAMRCMRPPAVRGERLLELASLWPQHGWIAFAASGLALDDDLGRAAARAATAERTLPDHRDAVAERSARLARAAAGEATPLDPEAGSSLLRAVALIEGDAPLTTEGAQVAEGAVMMALRHLHRGGLAEAVGAAQGTAFQDMAVVLAAASDGAPPALAARALSIPPETLGGAAAILAAAVAMRAGRDPTAYLDQLGDGDEGGGEVRAFMEALRAGPPEAAAAHLRGVDLELHATALAAGVTALGERAPATWRERAKALLFPGERPYYR